MGKAVQERSFPEKFILFVRSALKDKGFDTRGMMVQFVSDRPEEMLPNRCGLVVRHSNGYLAYCAFSELEGWTDLLDAIELWLKKI